MKQQAMAAQYQRAYNQIDVNVTIGQKKKLKLFSAVQPISPDRFHTIQLNEQIHGNTTPLRRNRAAISLGQSSARDHHAPRFTRDQRWVAAERGRGGEEVIPCRPDRGAWARRGRRSRRRSRARRRRRSRSCGSRGRRGRRSRTSRRARVQARRGQLPWRGRKGRGGGEGSGGWVDWHWKEGRGGRRMTTWWSVWSAAAWGVN